MCVRKILLRRSCSLGLLLLAGGAWAEEPPARETKEVVEIVVEKATEAAKGITNEAAAEAEKAAAAIIHQAAKQAEAAATDATQKITIAVDQAISKAGVTGAFVAGPYQIDLSLAPLPAALAAQLKLEGQGVLVDRAEKGGPAEMAGIQAHDVLVAVDGKPIANAKDLAGAVRESSGKELTIDLLRAGEKVSVKVKPRQSGIVTGTIALPAVEIDEEILKLESKIREKLKNAGVDVRMQLIRPGHVMPPNSFVAHSGMVLPEDVSITVRRKGSEPAEIEVTRGSEKWSIRGDKLDELPEELRPFVSQMLGRGRLPFGLQFDGPVRVVAPLPEIKATPAIGSKQVGDSLRKEAVARTLKDLEKQSKHARAHQSELLEQLNQRARQQDESLKAINETIERLSKQIETLQREQIEQKDGVIKEQGSVENSDN